MNDSVVKVAANPIARRGVLGLLILAALGTALPSRAQAVSFVTPQAIKTGPVSFTFVKVHCEITNTGAVSDSFVIVKDRSETPSAWDVSICVGGEDGFCYAPFVTQAGIRLAAGQTDTVSAYVTPKTGEGSGYSRLIVHAWATPLDTTVLSLGCITEGCDVLLVDDDGAGTVETFYQSAIPGGTPFGTWRRNLAPLHAPLGTFPVVAWLTGANAGTLDADDRTQLASYLAGGGRLFLSGQDIAYDLCDAGSPNYSPATRTWFEDKMNSTYGQNASGSVALNAVAGSPIAQGLALAISGGDGANNQTDPDVVTAATGAGADWRYGTGGDAAVRVAGETYNAVYFGFGFEAISTQANRNTVMSRVLGWLNGPLADVTNPPGQPLRTLSLSAPRPNPFRLELAIPFTLASAGKVELRILDLSGRVVRTLTPGQFPAGEHLARWDGAGADGRRAPSGVYWVELRSGVQLATRRVALLQ